MLNIHFTFVVVAIGLAGTACSTVPAEETVEVQPKPPVVTRDGIGVTGSGTTTAGFAGYQHSIGASKFAIGSSVREDTSDPRVDRWAGSDGTFSTSTTGLVLAVPNAHAASRHKAPFPGTSDVHNNLVKNYFTGAGLPNEQILDVQVHARMTAQGLISEFDPTKPPPGTLDGYYSYLRRQIAGVEVRESFAWARVDVDGEVVHESVFWPALPATLAQDVALFNSTMSAAGSAFTANLPAQAQEPGAGVVVIHHTPGTSSAAMATMVTYDVSYESRTHHFDANGNEVEIPGEEGAWSTAKPARATRKAAN